MPLLVIDRIKQEKKTPVNIENMISRLVEPCPCPCVRGGEASPSPAAPGPASPGRCKADRPSGGMILLQQVDISR